MPSTYRSATLGGLFGGGFGGVGSINHGPLAAPGNVLGVRAMTVEPEPQIVELRGAEAHAAAPPLGHQRHRAGAGGGPGARASTGLECIVAFEQFDAALEFADALWPARRASSRRRCASWPRRCPTTSASWPSTCRRAATRSCSLVAPHAEAGMRDMAPRYGGTRDATARRPTRWPKATARCSSTPGTTPRCTRSRWTRR